MYLFAQKFGFADELFKHIQVEGTEPVVEDILREINRGAWTIGYTGQSPERLKLHMENQQTSTASRCRRRGRSTATITACPGRAGAPGDEASGLAHPLRHLQAGEGRRRLLPRQFRRRARRRHPAGRGQLAQGLGDRGRLSRVHHGNADHAGLGQGPDGARSGRRREDRRRQGQLEDRPVGRHPAGRDQAWLRAVRQRQGALRGLELPRPGAVAPRAALHAAARPGGPVPDLGRPARLRLPLLDKSSRTRTSPGTSRSS